VAYNATRKVYDYARGNDERPWCITVSFTHPHDPYVARKKYWDLYEDCEHLLPEIPAMDYEDHDTHSKRIFDANDWRSVDITEDHIKRARRAYFANISYLDDKIGEVLEALETTKQEATILFLSDHGDMLGERGLWFKMSFFEGSSRVPLMVSSPTMEPGLITAPVSNIDVTPTLCELAGVSMDEVMPWTEGESLVYLGQGGERDAPVAMEYAAEASYAPMVSLRYGPWKYNRCSLDQDQLFNLDDDPHELTNLVDVAAHKGTLDQLRAKSEARWDLARFDGQVRESQARRWVVYEALRNGEYFPWDYQPLQKASERYMRNHMNLDNVEEKQRFPKGE
jgi:choline-sulfatase